MSDPFSSIAEYYDILIDWSSRLAREKPFFEKLFQERPVIEVLDVGCGSGHHSRMFAAMKANVTGMDPSVPMLERARSLTDGSNPQYIKGSMTDVKLLPGGYDLITVLGNTLPYVHGYDELVTVLTDMMFALKRGGRLCIQVVNFDAIMREESRMMPLVQREANSCEYLFVREHRRMGEYAEFTMSVLSREQGGVWNFTSERSLQYPITEKTLKKALLQAGYASSSSFGDYYGNGFAPSSSPSLIAVAVSG